MTDQEPENAIAVSKPEDLQSSNVAIEAVAATASVRDVIAIARNPGEMATAQVELIRWAADKLAWEQKHLADLDENLVIAKRNRWRSKTIEAAAGRSRHLVNYYEKVKAALEQGYCIVPNMPIDLFAVRTKHKSPRAWQTTSRWKHAVISTAERHEDKPVPAPIGEGEFVGANPGRVVTQIAKADPNVRGSEDEFLAYAKEHGDIAFPFSLEKPMILKATEQAMLLKTFDRIGVLPARPNLDPMVIGQIIDAAAPYSKKTISFLIAWFVDTKDL